MTENEYPPVPAEIKIIFWSLGDVDKNGLIDTEDLAILQHLIATKTYDPDGDLNGDAKIDMKDLAVCAKHQNLTIDQYWHDIVDRERMETKLSKETGVPNLPWYVDWIIPILEQQKTNLEAYAYWQQPAMQALVEGFKALLDMPERWQMLDAEAVEDKAVKTYDAGTNYAVKVLEGAAKPEVNLLLGPVYMKAQELGKDLRGNMTIVEAQTPKQKLGSISEAASRLDATKDGIIAASLLNWTVAQAAEAASMGQFEGLFQFEPMIASKFGWNSICGTAQSLPLKASMYIPAEQYYNTVFTPNIGGVGDVINLRHKNKLSAEEYALTMRMHGYDSYWQTRLLEGKLVQPSVTDALTAYRRGVIDADKLDALFELNELDPKYKDVFDVRKYDDLSVGEARLMFDLQVIQKPEVYNIVKRNGYSDADAEKLTSVLVDAPVRRLKTRYLLGLVREMGLGMIEETMVDVQVRAIGYSDYVAMWVKRCGMQQRRLLTRPSAGTVKEKLLGVGDLKAAYVRGLLTEDELRIELQDRGYRIDDIEILLELESAKQTVQLAGGKMYALSVAEYINAWRYEVVTEDDLRMKLIARGLPTDEIDILIKTKKLQWEIGNMGAGTPRLPLYTPEQLNAINGVLAQMGLPLVDEYGENV